MTHTPATRPQSAFMGLAPFLRMSIAGADLSPIGRELLARAQSAEGDNNAMQDLAIFMHCVGQHDLALTIQQQALQAQRSYHLPARIQPARLRLLALMAAGDLSANMPVDCLLENSDIDIELYYVDPQGLQVADVPEHDVLLVAIAESDSNDILLRALEPVLANWPRPVINAPANIPRVARDTASAMLQDVPGLLMPPTLRVVRNSFAPLASGSLPASSLLGRHDFPLIIRPVGSHAGTDLQKIDNAPALADYLASNPAEEFFVSAFIDYSGTDGQFRKYRIALIEGQAFACHMAISSHWMVHYVNAGMYQDAAKRAEEADFMQHFDAFASRHAAALHAIQQRAQLEYLCIDCAETRDGQLFIFEIDHAMVVHAMDPVNLFPYKQNHMQKVVDAFRALLFQKAGKPLPQGNPA